MAGGIIQLEEGWTRLKREGIDKLIRILEATHRGDEPERFTSREFAQLYTVCYTMCTQRSPYSWARDLYERHGQSFAEYLSQVVLPSLKGKHGDFLLAALAQRWRLHTLMNKWMNRFFMYLNRYYVEHSNLPTLREAGLAAFRAHIFDRIQPEATAALLEAVDRDRNGETVDRGLLRQVVEIYEAVGQGSLDTYRRFLEAPLVASCGAFYQRKAQEWTEHAVSEYLSLAEQALVAEARRVEQFLHPSSESKLLRAVELRLLVARGTELLERDEGGLATMLRVGAGDDLKRVYRLFSRIPKGLAPVSRLLRQHISAEGTAIVQQRQQAVAAGQREVPGDPEFVQKLLNLLTASRGIVTEHLGNGPVFQRAVREGMEVPLNQETKAKFSNTELLAAYADRLLKPGGDRVIAAGQTVEAQLDRVVSLFAYIHDKDRFGEIYRNHLSRRLLGSKSESDDNELYMISKFKTRCGAQYTNKMEGMVSDLQLSKSMTQTFGAWCAGEGAEQAATLGLDFSVQVLTTGWWPTFKEISVKLPPVLSNCQDVFARYYAGNTSHRRLAWAHSLGTTEMRGRFVSGAYSMVNINTLQAVALLFFNGKGADEEVEVRAVGEALGLSDDVVKRVLHSLCCGRHKVLRKVPDTRAIASSDKVAYNPGFAAPTRRLRFAMASLEASHNPKKVEDDRRVAVDAAIVRLMKTSKTLRHQELFSGVLRQLQFFQPDPKLIKRRIEHCIDNDYLERDENDNTLYHYVA